MQKPMSAMEFSALEALLRGLNPEDGIKFIETSDVSGNILGTTPIHWSSDYIWNDGVLIVHGHGIEKHIIESKLGTQIDIALDKIRGKA